MSLCYSCGKNPKWRTYILCRDCIDSSFVKECIICGCGPNAPMEHMRKVKLQRCSQCHSQWYCSREHQKTDWPFHRRFCDSLGDMQNGVYLQLKKEKSCITCEKSDVKLSRCGNCHTVKYCSKKCQRENIVDHKKVCECFLALWNRYHSSK